MSQKVTTMTKIILGPGHVMSDKDPMPAKFRRSASKPVSESVKKKKPK